MPAFSEDGRFIIFASFANNLVTNDTLAPFLDIFVRDLTTSNTTLVTANLTGVGGGNGSSGSPAISSNGQFVAFESAASDLILNSTQGLSDVFVRDLLTGTTTLVSVHNASDSNSLSTAPLISSDGRWVTFESTAFDLVTNQTLQPPFSSPVQNIYARDMVAGVTVLVSIDVSGAAGGNLPSDLAGISSDGRWVAFASASTNFVLSTNSLPRGEVYARDLQGHRTILASTEMPSLLPGYTGAMNPVLSKDGRFVFFQAAGNSTNLYRFDLQLNTTTLVSANVQNRTAPATSLDGRFVAFEKFNFVYFWDGQFETTVLASVSPSGSPMTNIVASSQPVIAVDGSKVLFLSADSRTNGLVQLYLRDLQAATTSLISAATNGSLTTDLSAILPAISPDGNFVAFDSLSDRIVADDLNQASDVFVRDLNAGRTHLISQRHLTLPAEAGAGLCTLGPNNLSADSRFLVFSSLDSTLVSGDTNGWQDVFVRDFVNGTTLPVSVSSSSLFTNTLNAHDSVISANGRFVAYAVGATPPFEPQRNLIFRRDLRNAVTQPVSVLPGYFASSPSISPDGRLVAFQTSAPGAQLVPNLGDGNSANDIFVTDMGAGTNQLISVNLLGTSSGNHASSNAVFSPDGRWVFFLSAATDLVANNTAGKLSLFGRDLWSNRTETVSVGLDGTPQSGLTGESTASADSRMVAFVATNSILIRDLEMKTTTVACTNCGNPCLDSRGRWIVFETFPPSSVESHQVIFKDLQTGATNLISVNQSGHLGGNGNSVSPLISADGQFVVFYSKASDLVDNDTNRVGDIFVRDRQQGTTLLVSLNGDRTAPGNAVSSKPVIGADGRTVLFQSFASDLVAGDYNYTRDIFVLRLSASDTDNDGMDDYWEQLYFSTLSRDGTGDFDGDGMSDLQEFLAGTDPTNNGSILRVLALSSLAGGGNTLFWSAQPGKRYRVQFKNSLTETDWSNLSDPVTASSTTASLPDNSSGSQAQRFYRVVLLP